MAVSKDLLGAARALGAALNDSPVVQEYRQAREAVMNDADLRKLEGEMERVYGDLIARQEKGEMLFPAEINAFYALREQYNRHPLVIRYGQCETAMRALCEQAGGAMSSILSVDYPKLVGSTSTMPE